jgi:hypothetical protein
MQAFDTVEVVPDKQAVIGHYDLIIEPKPPVLRIDGHCGGAMAAAFAFGILGAALSTQNVEAQAFLRVEVRDKNDQILMAETNYSSGMHTKPFGGMDEATPHVGTAVGEALADVLQEMIRAVATSAKIRTYARSLSAKRVGHPQEDQPLFFSNLSDVDEPPRLVRNPSVNRHAVLIGIEQYRERLSRADLAVQDVKIVNQYLTKLMGYAEENVAVLLNDHATKTDIEKFIEGWLANRVQKEDRVLIYFSGHGAPSQKTGEAYLVPYDGDPAFIEKTGYSLKRLYEHLSKLPAKEVVVVLDSCFSGAGGRSVIAEGTRPMVLSIENPILAGGRTVVLAASAGSQMSNTFKEKGHGLFTYYFLKGLQGEADTNKDGTVSLLELFDYLEPQVERVARREFNNEQTPQLLGNPEVIRGLRLVEKVVP